MVGNRRTVLSEIGHSGIDLGRCAGPRVRVGVALHIWGISKELHPLEVNM